MTKANILRGKKWTTAREIAIYENRNQDVKWIDENPAIQKDIKAYQTTLTPIETKSKGKK